MNNLKLTEVEKIKEINLMELFRETYERIYPKSVKFKFNTQRKFNELLYFFSNSSYWTRYNPKPRKRDNDSLSGKYLNKVHNELCRVRLYDDLYKQLLTKYMELTEYKTLENISIDSMFVRNMLGEECRRNPAYNNKPGFKVHCIVDSNRVPIAIDISDCCKSDGNPEIIDALFKKKFINDDLLKEHSNTLLGDSAYSTFYNIYNITSNIKLDILMSRNRIHISEKSKKTIKMADDQQRSKYKERHVVENIFGIVQRTPCVINNYEKETISYRGVFMFTLCSILAKLINKLIRQKNNVAIAKKAEIDNIVKRNATIKRHKIKKKKNDVIKINTLIEAKQRQKKNEALKNRINKLITKHIMSKNKIKIKNKHDHMINIIKSQCEQKKKQFVVLQKYHYDKFEKKVIDDTLDDINNNYLTKTTKIEFCEKYNYLIDVKKNAFCHKNIKKVSMAYDMTTVLNNVCDAITKTS